MKNPVLVTTAHRGVFFGDLVREDEDKKICIIKNARCAIRWNTEYGFLQLAKEGPNSGSRIGSTCPELKLLDVTGVAKCTKEATEAWISA